MLDFGRVDGALETRKKIAPDVERNWFWWRPVAKRVVTYKEMFVDHLYDWDDVDEMHQLLDMQGYDEGITNYITEQERQQAAADAKQASKVSR